MEASKHDSGEACIEENAEEKNHQPAPAISFKVAEYNTDYIRENNLDNGLVISVDIDFDKKNQNARMKFLSITKSLKEEFQRMEIDRELFEIERNAMTRAITDAENNKPSRKLLRCLGCLKLLHPDIGQFYKDRSRTVFRMIHDIEEQYEELERRSNVAVKSLQEQVDSYKRTPPIETSKEIKENPQMSEIMINNQALVIAIAQRDEEIEALNADIRNKNTQLTRMGEILRREAEFESQQRK